MRSRSGMKIDWWRQRTTNIRKPTEIDRKSGSEGSGRQRGNNQPTVSPLFFHPFKDKLNAKVFLVFFHLFGTCEAHIEAVSRHRTWNNLYAWTPRQLKEGARLVSLFQDGDYVLINTLCTHTCLQFSLRCFSENFYCILNPCSFSYSQ